MARFEYEDVNVSVIIQAVGGDLRLRGRDGGWLIVEGDAAEVEQIGEGQPYVVRSGGDVRVVVPDHVNVSVQSVGGDAKITDLGGETDVQAVGGDLVVRNTDGIQIKTTGGDLRVKRITGNVTVESVGDDATIREVDGAVWAASIGSDLYVRNIDGGCVVEQVGSDLVLSIDFASDQEYRFSAGGDILCRVQPDANAQFVLPIGAEVRLDVDAEITEDEDSHQIVTLGDGSATVQIDGAASLRLVGEEENFMINFGIQIEEELEARLSTLEEKLSTQLEGLDERIQAKTAQFATQAEKFAQRAQRQAERATERIRRSMDRKPQKRKPGPRRVVMSMQGDLASRRNASEPVSEQERMVILKMVQENKISIEEAERLLSALDS